MAKQLGIFKVKGTLDEVTFFKGKEGHLLKLKGGIDAHRIKNDPAFARTRENGAEFGRAGKAGKVLRTAIRPILQSARDARGVSRLTKQFIKVLQADLVSARGQRNVIDGDLRLLEGFEFNIHGKLSATLYAPYTASINRAQGELTIDLPPFVPAHMIALPDGATHYKIVTSGSAIDFTNGSYEVQHKETAPLPVDNNPTALMNIVHTVTPGTADPMVLLLGIQFFQEVNGSMYPLKNGAFNALAVVKVEG